MKKVLALVLAVIMVCTMAMAVKVEGTTNSGASGGDYAVVNPGTTLKVTFTPNDNNDQTEDDGIHFYLKDGKFVPANNEVKITFAKGADLFESKGWVKIDDNEEGVAGYEYQIKLKSNLNKIVDKSVADIQISKITFKSTGYDLVEVFAETKASNYISYAYGYEQNNVILQEGNASTFTFAENSINVITSLLDKAGKEVSSLKVLNNGMTYTFNKGAKVYAMKDAVAFNETDDAGYKQSEIMTYANLLNSAANVIYEKGAHVDTTYRVYAKGVDGKVKSVVATTTDGVMTFTVPALSTVIVTTDVLTTTGTVGTATETTPGTTTNPGTGANDVVGVAAALAVVALVSGAAISLKK